MTVEISLVLRSYKNTLTQNPTKTQFSFSALARFKSRVAVKVKQSEQAT